MIFKLSKVQNVCETTSFRKLFEEHDISLWEICYYENFCHTNILKYKVGEVLHQKSQYSPSFHTSGLQYLKLHSSQCIIFSYPFPTFLVSSKY